jgi:hypothetical protein
MSTPQPADAALREAVQQVLARGLTISPSAAQLADMTAHIYETILREVKRLLGETGARALFRRSLTLVQAEFSWLTAVAISPPDALLPRLLDALRVETLTVGMAAAAAALAALIELLATFIGESLTARLLADAWPEGFPDLPPLRKR